MVSKVLPSARSVLCAVGLSMLFGASAFGQAAGVIRGRVTDAAARSIPEVAIGISGTTLGALTNSSGDYVLSNVPAGRRVVTTRRIGYTRATRSEERRVGKECS